MPVPSTTAKTERRFACGEIITRREPWFRRCVVSYAQAKARRPRQ
jgi:hypothetical protein